MKKKLLLNRETVRKLTTEDLHEVAGGKKSDKSYCCTLIPQLPNDTNIPVQPIEP